MVDHIKLRSYCISDFDALVKLMEGLQNYLVGIDPNKRLRMKKSYGRSYTNALLKDIKENRGTILLAEVSGKVVGCIAGIIQKQTKENLLECVPTRRGIIKELYINEDYRSYGLGKRLMEKLEFYFKTNKCTVIEVAVFTPNTKAHAFYQQRGYINREMNMLKII